MSTDSYNIVDGKIEWSNIYRFPDGSPRPKCINIGCNNPVVCCKGNQHSPPSERALRTVCSYCHTASFGKTKKDGNKVQLRKGVVSFKKLFCENIDGHVTGEKCTASNLISGQLELDHIDGNHINNIPSNVQTLCKNCHSLKSMQAGDFKKLCKSHTSPLAKQSPSNISSLNPDLFDLSKMPTIPQTPNLYTEDCVQLEIPSLELTKEF